MSATASPASTPHPSFRAARQRNRASARHWSLLMHLALLLMTWLLCLLLAPVMLALIGLALDAVNTATPMPDLLGHVARLIDAAVNGHQRLPIAPWLGYAALAALPALAVLWLAWRRLGRIAFHADPAALHTAIGLRAPLPGDLEEQQLSNIVAEMAIAARVEPPKLAFIDSPACNLGLVGEGANATLIATRGLVDQLDRAPTEALVGQLISALGNGDGRLAQHMLHISMMIGLLNLAAQAPLDRAQRAKLRPVFRLRRSRDSDLAALRGVLGDALGGDDGDGAAANSDDDDASSWRDWLLMPLMGSLIIGVVVVPILTMVFIAPLSGMIWRRRRLAADASAVEFTRDPQALAEAYARLAEQTTSLDSGARWLGDLFALDGGGGSNLRLGSPYPKLATRIARLDTMGAHVDHGPSSSGSPITWALIAIFVVVVLALLGATVFLAVCVSLALNGLFLAIPTAAIHVALRALAAH